MTVYKTENILFAVDPISHSYQTKNKQHAIISVESFLLDLIIYQAKSKLHDLFKYQNLLTQDSTSPFAILKVNCMLLVLQILNLTQALKDCRSPVQLVQMPVVTVERNKSAVGRTRADSEVFTQSFQHKAPFFSWC